MKGVFLLCLLFLAIIASAQTDTRKLQIGFGGGLNYLFVNPKIQSGNQSSMIGYNGGLVADYSLSKRFSVSTRLSYIKEGWKYKSGLTDPLLYSMMMTNSYSWLGVPVHLNYFFRPTMPTSFFVGLGCSMRRLLSSDTRIETQRANGIAYEGSSSINQTNDWNFLASLQAGIRFSLPHGGKVLTTFSYERGLTNLNTKLEQPASVTYDYAFQPSPSLKINSLSIGISYIY